MFLKSLQLSNFRNISKVELDFKKNINIFIGNNAQGKTNILESIYFLALTKSHRTNDETNLIENNSLFTRVSGIFNDDRGYPNYLSIVLNRKGKKVSVNNLVQKKISNYLSRLKVIMFCPDDLEIIKGSPNLRRRFLNIEISQLNKNYIILLKEYNILLKQRNEYLKRRNNSIIDENYFDILTQKLIQKNIEIIKLRYKFVKELNKYLSQIFNFISGMGDLVIEYKSFIKENDLKDENLIKNINNKFKNVFQTEILQKTTLIGCHKDDFKLYLNNNDVTSFCSQGQLRLSILSLKLSEIEVFIKENKTYPIILLDDIFSELDDFKKNNIIKYFKDNTQIFITTTEINNISNDLKEKSDIYILDNGKVVKEGE